MVVSKQLTFEDINNTQFGDWVWVIPTNKWGRYCQVCGQEDIDIFVADYIDNTEYSYDTYGVEWVAYKNKEYAESEGSIIELPCKRGDFMWNVSPLPIGGISKYKITNVDYIKGQVYVEAVSEYGGLIGNALWERYCHSEEEAIERLAELNKQFI